MFWRMFCLLLSMLGESHVLTLVLFCPSGAAAGGKEALWEHGAAARWAVVRWIQTRSQLAEEHRRDPGPRGIKDQKHFLNCGAHSRITNLSMFGLANTLFLENPGTRFGFDSFFSTAVFSPFSVFSPLEQWWFGDRYVQCVVKSSHTQRYESFWTLISDTLLLCFSLC